MTCRVWPTQVKPETSYALERCKELM